MFEIFEVNSKKKLKQFIDFPRKLYSKEPNYVTDLDITLKSKLGKKNPFLRHSQIALFLAREAKTQSIVGRIAAIHNSVHISRYKDDSGFFGLFDSINNAKVSELLLQRVSNWLLNKGLKNIIGPTNLTTNDSSGVLLRGFEYPNQVNMPYNYPYYHSLLSSFGFKKVIDLYAYYLVDKPSLDKYSSIMQRVEKRLAERGMVVRSMSACTYKNDIKLLREAYNKFNGNNWGFIPLNENEFKHMASELKSIMPYKLAWMAEKEGKIIGYIIAVPDFNQVLKHIPSGKLFPSGIFKILKYRRSIDSSRVMLIGIDDKFRGSGLDLVLYHKITKALYKQNIYQCECSYVMSSNKTMNSLMLKMGGSRIKEYRLYKKQLI